jgi:nucleoside-diphosphate-sugar epimerase
MARHLITGGARFIGSPLAELLLNRGGTRSVIDNLSTGRFSNIAALEKNDRFRCFVDDVRNEDLFEELVRDADFILQQSPTDVVVDVRGRGASRDPLARTTV